MNKNDEKQIIVENSEHKLTEIYATDEIKWFDETKEPNKVYINNVELIDITSWNAWNERLAEINLESQTLKERCAVLERALEIIGTDMQIRNAIEKAEKELKEKY